MRKQYYLAEKTGSLRGPFAGYEIVSLLDEGVIDSVAVIRDDQGRKLTAAKLDQIEQYKGNMRRNAGASAPPQNPGSESEEVSSQIALSQRRFLTRLVDAGFILVLFCLWTTANSRQHDRLLPWLADAVSSFLIGCVVMMLWNWAVRSTLSTEHEKQSFRVK